jgi:hypothetical protein
MLTKTELYIHTILCIIVAWVIIPEIAIFTTLAVIYTDPPVARLSLGDTFGVSVMGVTFAIVMSMTGCKIAYIFTHAGYGCEDSLVITMVLVGIMVIFISKIYIILFRACMALSA